MNQDTWNALVQGGIGPDVWDRELQFTAVDFRDAANQAMAKAEELGGHVVSLEWFWREPSVPKTHPVSHPAADP